MAWTLCTSGAAAYKAGINCNAISGSAVTMAEWSDEAEGSICTECHTDFINNYSTYSSLSGSLADICSSKIAKKIIAYDTTGYLSREADMLMNLNDDIETKGLQILKDKTKQRLGT